MTILINETNIEHTKGDTFILGITPRKNEEFSEGSQLTFIISKDETSEPIINKTVELSSGGFKITLTPQENSVFDFGPYIYKISIKSMSNEIITETSGDFIVKWGA